LNLPFYIAKRYLISKKSHNIINIISGISVSGITIGTMALIVVLSVFNGFEGLIISLFDSFNPDLQISANKGKTFSLTTIHSDKIKKIEGVIYYTEVIEENVLFQYNKKQHLGFIKGVSEDFIPMTGINNKVIKGDAIIKNKHLNFALVGTGVAYFLDIRNIKLGNALTIYAPQRKKGYQLSIENSFNKQNIFPSGIFSIQQELDEKYIITPIEFARKLLNYKNEVSFIELGLAKDVNLKSIQKEIKNILGKNFTVKNRFEQQELLYKILKSEKLAIYIILTFILIIAAFNVIGSLSMLILDKKKDIQVLQSMGATNNLIKKIFLIEGSIVSILGAVSGLLLGVIICWTQMKFSIISLGDANGSFVVNAYPVQMQFIDFVTVFVTVCIIGIGAAWIPVQQISKKYLSVKLS
jgi:lipoprotein-releasing system permease protein